MPTFDLRGIKIGKYINTEGTITYESPISMGDAMSVELNLTAAEGRLYAESRLAEYKKLITGGTASVGVKYITDAAQKLLFGMSENTRNVGTNTSQKSLKATAKDIAKYVGMGFYAPDAIDGTDKYTAVFVYKVLFGAPGYVYATKGDSITFQTLDGMVKIDGQSMALIGTFAAVAAAIVVVEKALIDLTVQQAEWAKEIESGSSQLGMSTESYQQLDYVMQSVGYSMDQAKGDLSALAEKAQDAASGSGEAAEMFDRLGVSVTNTDGTMKSQAQLFTEVYSALAQMSDVTNRNAIASKLLGTTGEEAVIPMLEKYGRAIERVASAAPIVKDEDIQKLAFLSDSLGMFEAKMEAAKSKVAAAFAPALEQVIQIVGDLAMQFAEFAADTGLVDLFGTIIELAGNLLQALEPVLDILNLLKPVFQAIGGVLALFADAVKVVVNAVGALTDTLDYLFSFGQKRFDTSNIQSIANVFSGTDSSFGRWMGSVAHNAAGTDNWRGGLTWVGENGPELVNLPKGSQVLTNQESRSVGGDTFNISVNMSQISDIQKLIDMSNNYRRSVRMGYGG